MCYSPNYDNLQVVLHAFILTVPYFTMVYFHIRSTEVVYFNIKNKNVWMYKQIILIILIQMEILWPLLHVFIISICYTSSWYAKVDPLEIRSELIVINVSFMYFGVSIEHAHSMRTTERY
jgi:hypothetical protein